MGEKEKGLWPPMAPLGSDRKFPAGLSVFFPAFNDAPSLPLLLERTFETLRRAASDYEVIVVNDGSTDETAELLEALSRKYEPFLRVVSHPRNFGYGAALRSGFAAASKEFVFYTDGDSQYDPAEMEKLLLAITPGTALVNGYKIERSDPWHRIAIGWLYNSFARWLFRIRLRDIDCDFRLVRRSALDLGTLQSTGGTICVELVRSLEMTGAEILELPVHHYARRHGRSQFFRVRSLAITFVQLCSVFSRLVLAPLITGAADSTSDEPSPFSWRKAAFVTLTVTVLAMLAYARALWLPFISDDYVQIQLARDYGPVSQWGALASDALYRCRATSLVLTYWLERLVGLNPYYYNAASLLLHLANSLLVFALGLWRPVGWRISAVAACFFAVCQRHSEAVVWFAAIPELLVFFFVVAGFLFWLLWLEAGERSRQVYFYLGAFVSYILALLSKESAVALVPLCGLATLLHPTKSRHRMWGLTPFAITAAGYFALGYAARRTHLHFNDGTFSLDAPFVETVIRGMGGLLWVWGIVSLPLLFGRFVRPRLGLLVGAFGWMVFALLPYSFLTYMPRVPSRHTYLASVGLSLIVSLGFLAFRRTASQWNQGWLTPALACLIVVHQCGYLWLIKHTQYENRARPTEDLIRVSAEGTDVIRASCFPYSPEVAHLALDFRWGQNRPKFVTGPEVAQLVDSRDFCNADANGVHY